MNKFPFAFRRGKGFGIVWLDALGCLSKQRLEANYFFAGLCHFAPLFIT
jgi:hypothetical protein